MQIIFWILNFKMLYIYILELIASKYYIGKTTNPDFRLESHFNANGSVWTHMYKPLKVIELISGCDSFDEDKYTLKYMEKYGIDNVRGGSFCQIKLSEENTNTIHKMIKSSSKSNDNNNNINKYNEYIDKFNNLQEIK
jgi:predicted GIY-YIG superfamily endonuclease